MNNNDKFSDPFVYKGKVTLLKKFLWVGLIILLLGVGVVFLQPNPTNPPAPAQSTENNQIDQATQTKEPSQTAETNEATDSGFEANTDTTIRNNESIETRDPDSDSDRLAEPNSPEPAASQSGYIKFDDIKGESDG